MTYDRKKTVAQNLNQIEVDLHEARLAAQRFEEMRLTDIAFQLRKDYELAQFEIARLKDELEQGMAELEQFKASVKAAQDMSETYRKRWEDLRTYHKTVEGELQAAQADRKRTAELLSQALEENAKLRAGQVNEQAAELQAKVVDYQAAILLTTLLRATDLQSSHPRLAAMVTAYLKHEDTTFASDVTNILLAAHRFTSQFQVWLEPLPEQLNRAVKVLFSRA